ncbi:TetR family transcriptional regulator [Winogradskya humida]|uniref:Regulatory protein, TetR family n=1 Tax=Winogradskya humida TaxID=113566 RepID=A0ABQ4A7F8_9ACTN|nr:TetR family transcriptional regulator [Actinoplanes humidus]GIE26805.1 putative regulatory protein, TetR family [Actinoplanes humidus]
MPYDADATRARIFAAAAEEFAAAGIGGARIERIAERAQANKSLIYRYFTSKEKLFAAVLMGELAALAESVTLDPGRIVEYIGELFDYHVTHPRVIRLMVAEGFHYGTADVPDQPARTAYYQGKVAAVQRAEADPALAPQNLTLILVGLVGWFFAAPQISRMILDREPLDPAVLATHRAALLEAARRLVKPAI